MRRLELRAGQRFLVPCRDHAPFGDGLLPVELFQPRDFLLPALVLNPGLFESEPQRCHVGVAGKPWNDSEDHVSARDLHADVRESAARRHHLARHRRHHLSRTGGAALDDSRRRHRGAQRLQRGRSSREIDLPLLLLQERDPACLVARGLLVGDRRLPVRVHRHLAEFVRIANAVGFERDRERARARDARPDDRLEDPRRGRRRGFEAFLCLAAAAQRQDEPAFPDRLEVGQPRQVRGDLRILAGAQGLEFHEQFRLLREMGDGHGREFPGLPRGAGVVVPAARDEEDCDNKCNAAHGFSPAAIRSSSSTAARAEYSSSIARVSASTRLRWASSSSRIPASPPL